MSKEKKVKKAKKEKNEKVESLLERLRNQSDKKNYSDCVSILMELNQASMEGEYSRTFKLKVNQAHYIEKLGLPVKEERSGFYEISWK